MENTPSFLSILRWRLAQTLLRLSVPKRLRMHTPDRALLEKIIFRSLFLDGDVQRILFIGCHPYSSWYWRIFSFSKKEFYTVDPDPSAAHYGSPGRHFICTLQSLPDHTELLETFDVAIMNGVFNYGINTIQEKQDAMTAIQRLLKKQGRTIVGFRDGSSPDIDIGLFASHFEKVNVPGMNIRHAESGSTNGHAFVCFKKTSV